MKKLILKIALSAIVACQVHAADQLVGNLTFTTSLKGGTTTPATITIPSAGGLTITAAGTNQNITLTPSGSGNVVLSTALRAVNGGTGQTTFAQGDILYASSSTALSRLAPGTSGQFLQTQGAAANPQWSTPAGAGDFVGPAVAVDNTIVRFNGTTGKLGQASGVVIDDSNNITVPGTGTHTFGTTNTISMAAGVLTASGQDTSILKWASSATGEKLVAAVATDQSTAADRMGLGFWGKNSTANVQTYAQIFGVIEDPTAATEDGSFMLRVKTAGSMQTSFTSTVALSNFYGDLTIAGAFTGSGTGTNSLAGPLYINLASGDPQINFGVASVVKGYIGVASTAGGIIADSAQYDTAIRTASGKTFRVSTDGGSNSALAVTQALTTVAGNFTAAGAYIGSTQALSGAGAANVTTETTKITSTGVADAITLADGTNGQIKRVIHDVDGGSFVLTPTTRNNWSSFTSTAAGESITLQFVTTRGWTVVGSYLGTVAP